MVLKLQSEVFNNLDCIFLSTHSKYSDERDTNLSSGYTKAMM